MVEDLFFETCSLLMKKAPIIQAQISAYCGQANDFTRGVAFGKDTVDIIFDAPHIANMMSWCVVI